MRTCALLGAGLICALACAAPAGRVLSRAGPTLAGLARLAPPVAAPSTPASPPARGPLDLLPPPSLGPAALGLGADAAVGTQLDPTWASILAEGAVDGGEITFTFDDGPAEEPWLTPEVLRLLREHRVRATFFLTGSRLLGRDRLAEARREIARRIVREGHLIGNHALDHRDLSRERRGQAWIRREIDESSALIERVVGVRPHWFRPPYGKVGPTAREVLGARGDELVLWTIDGQDVAENDPDRLARRLCGQLQFAGQGVVLLHDLRPSSVQALALVLQWLDHRRRDVGAPDRPEGAAAPRDSFSVVDLPTFLAHAATRPHREGRAELYRARKARMEAAAPRPAPSDPLAPATGAEPAGAESRKVGWYPVEPWDLELTRQAR